MDIPILFEDDALVVINKPSGLVVNRAESVKEKTVEDWAREKFKSGIDRAGIVHRIDKETSGLLVIAKTPESFSELQRQFKNREIKKTYLALVHGIIVPKEGEIRAPVGRLPWNPKRFGIVPEGKEAVTKYKVVKDNLVELYPETGRTHQIRVHLKYLGHPIVGDYLYAGRKTARDDRTWAPRVMLHAWKLTILHPRPGGKMSFEAPMPDDMMKALHGS